MFSRKTSEENQQISPTGRSPKDTPEGRTYPVSPADSPNLSPVSPFKTSPKAKNPGPPIAMIGPYCVTKELGQGAYATVRLGIHSLTGQEVALKLIDKRKVKSGSSLYRRLETEVAVLHHLHHPNITQLVEFMETPHHFVIAMELVSGPDFYHFLRHTCVKARRGLPTEQTFRFFHQLVSAVGVCHSYGIAHRDIKPENILFDEETETLKLTDFGMAGLVKNRQLMETSCGSPHYAAPEIVRGEKYHGPACDVWSLGIVLFVMSSGRLPFVHSSIPRLLEMICHGLFEMPADFCPDLRDLIKRMLCPSYRHRITITQIKEHPWWRKHCAALDLPFAGFPENPRTKAADIVPSNSDSSDALKALLATQFREPKDVPTGPISGPYDMEVFGCLIGLLGCVVPDELTNKLCTEGANVEKLYYALLLQQKRSLGTLAFAKKAMLSDSEETLSTASLPGDASDGSGPGATPVFREDDGGAAAPIRLLFIKDSNSNSHGKTILSLRPTMAIADSTDPSEKPRLAQKMKSFFANVREKLCGKRPPLYQK